MKLHHLTRMLKERQILSPCKDMPLYNDVYMHCCLCIIGGACACGVTCIGEAPGTELDGWGWQGVARQCGSSWAWNWAPRRWGSWFQDSPSRWQVPLRSGEGELPDFAEDRGNLLRGRGLQAVACGQERLYWGTLCPGLLRTATSVKLSVHWPHMIGK